MKRYKLLEISWVDSLNHSSKTWFKPHDVIGAFEPVGLDPFRTIGYLVEKTKQYITIAGDLHFYNDEVVSVGRCMTIPMGCVESIIELD